MTSDNRQQPHTRTCLIAAAALLLIELRLSSCNVPAQEGAVGEVRKPADNTAPAVLFVPVEKDVKLEVLDWGGTGGPLVMLAGLGGTAHDFDSFAPKLVPAYHVYGITRRSYGASSKRVPDCGNYSADRLGDDVLQVMEALHLKRPVLVGHSLAGEELSSIGSRFSEKVAGLIYLEAGYAYAYYDANAVQGDPLVDMAVARRQMEQLASPISPRERKAVVKQLLDTSLPRLEREFKAQQQHLETVPDNAPAPPDTPEVRFGFAVQRGVQEYTGVK